MIAKRTAKQHSRAMRCEMPDGPIIPSPFNAPLIEEMSIVPAIEELRLYQRTVPKEHWHLCQEFFIDLFCRRMEKSWDPAVQIPALYKEIERLSARAGDPTLPVPNGFAYEVRGLRTLADAWRDAFENHKHGAAQCHAFEVGQQFSRVRAMDFEPAAQMARKRKLDGSKGHQSTHGSEAEKRARWDDWQRRYNRLRVGNPGLKKRSICRTIVAELKREGGAVVFPCPPESPVTWLWPVAGLHFHAGAARGSRPSSCIRERA